ncbi:hypothetical protein GCM10009105_36200 [Dokdonella soli]|uniref:Uncharacterized protein n=1 Tax=Dokdonella soli TaxID=529810 RepID=A0ABN1IYB0_9GAMM
MAREGDVSDAIGGVRHDWCLQRWCADEPIVDSLALAASGTGPDAAPPQPAPADCGEGASCPRNPLRHLAGSAGSKAVMVVRAAGGPNEWCATGTVMAERRRVRAVGAATSIDLSDRADGSSRNA